MNESESGVLLLTGTDAWNFLNEISKWRRRLVSWVGFKLWGNFQDSAIGCLHWFHWREIKTFKKFSFALNILTHLLGIDGVDCLPFLLCSFFCSVCSSLTSKVDNLYLQLWCYHFLLRFCLMIQIRNPRQSSYRPVQTTSLNYWIKTLRGRRHKDLLEQ